MGQAGEQRKPAACREYAFTAGGSYRIVHMGLGWKDSEYHGIPEGQVGLSLDTDEEEWTVLIKPIACP